MMNPSVNSHHLLHTAPAQAQRLRLGIITLVLLALIGVADWFTGPEIAFSFVYLFPVSLMTWKGGRWYGLATAGLCGAVWLGVELWTNTTYSHSWIPYWNGLVRLGVFTLVAVLISEVADRKRAEAALEHQRGILQSILDSMREGVIVSRHDGRLLLINPAAESLLDVEALEPKPATYQELLNAGLRDRLAAARNGEDALSRGLHGELVPEAEILLHDVNSQERWLRIHGRPWLDPDGRNYGGMVVLSDITARRNLERQIAEVSDREQRRLGQDLHDGLCQWLVSATFLARMLADKLSRRDLPEAQDAGRIAEMLDESITQAKDVARGLYPVQLEVGGLASALEELAAQVRSRFHLNCTFTDGSESPLTELPVMNDLFRIAQEAVSNAVKHAGARAISISLETSASESRLRVADDGRGMPSTDSHERGLGLHMMRSRARMIGAELQITRTPGAGTVVTCCLPRWQETEIAPDSKAPAVNA